MLADNTVVSVDFNGDLTPWSIDSNTGVLTKGTVIAGGYSWLAAHGSNVYASDPSGITSFTANNGTLMRWVYGFPVRPLCGVWTVVHAG